MRAVRLHRQAHQVVALQGVRHRDRIEVQLVTVVGGVIAASAVLERDLLSEIRAARAAG